VYIFSRRKAKEEIPDWMTYQIYSATAQLAAAPLAVSQSGGEEMTRLQAPLLQIPGDRCEHDQLPNAH
jgi:hypothetical protein